MISHGSTGLSHLKTKSEKLTSSDDVASILTAALWFHSCSSLVEKAYLKSIKESTGLFDYSFSDFGVVTGIIKTNRQHYWHCKSL